MRNMAPPLLPLLRSRVQGELLAMLYLHPDQEFSLSQLAPEVHTTVKTISQEVTRLVDAGILTDRRSGNQRMVRAATHTILSRPLTDLLLVTFGPLPVLTDLLRKVSGVSDAYIYGSWAARYDGLPGPIPADVDVLVIGSPSLDDLDEAAEAAQTRLRRPVNIRRILPATWQDPDPADPFLASVRSRPLTRLEITGPIDDLTEE